MLTPFALFQGIHQLWYGPDVVHVQGRRARRALMLASLAMLAIGTAWGAFFIAMGNWNLVAFDLVIVLAGGSTALLIWRNLVHSAAVVTFGVLFLVVVLIAWIFDAPTLHNPRVTHLYLLPLGVGALMAFRDSRIWLRHGVAALYLGAFGILSLGFGSPWPELALPEAVRATGGGIQVVAAMAMLYGMLHVMQNDAFARSALESELQQAVAHQQFELHYQPQLDSQGRVTAAEALVRWQHPERGLVLPGKFIELAEQTGLILPLGQWVMEQACGQLQAWATQPGYAHLRLAVNISQLQFRQKDFVAQVLGLIEQNGIQAGLLELEITESMLVEDLSDIIEKMGALRRSGVTFSLDDFGTGYSSLNHLKRLPLNQLKIDQSFVRDVLTDANDASIARTVVALGHNLGLTVIAEGVETAEQHAFLAACGCEFFQGFLFSPALPIAAFERYVQDSTPRGATRCAGATPWAA